MTSTTTRRRRRVLPVLAGVVLGLISLVVLTVGGFAAASADHDGYVDLGHATYRSDSHAVLTEAYDWSRGTFLAGKLGTVRVQITPDGNRPAFVGLAPADKVGDYLRDAGYATGHPASNYHVTYTTHAGGAPSTPPARAGIWTVHRTGTGPMTVTFPAGAYHGDLVLVAMNTDGSPMVAGTVRTAATVPARPWIATVTLAVGAVLLLASLVLIIAPRRRWARRRTA